MQHLQCLNLTKHNTNLKINFTSYNMAYAIGPPWEVKHLLLKKGYAWSKLAFWYID